MKAVIKVLTAEDKFSQDQIAIMKRVALVLQEHNLSVALLMKKEKVYKQCKLKVV
jgi:predicted transcriptional regulator